MSSFTGHYRITRHVIADNGQRLTTHQEFRNLAGGAVVSDLRKLVEESLPRLDNPNIHRPTLVGAVVGVLAQWPGIRTDVPPYTRLMRQVSKINSGVAHALKQSAVALEALGAERELKLVLADRAKLGLDPSAPLPLPTGYSALLDAYIIAKRARHELERWERLHGHMRRSDPRSLAKRIVGQLRTIIVLQAGYKQFQLEQFLKRISGKHGLPKLTFETIKKTKHRARKPAKPKQKGTFKSKNRKKCPSAQRAPVRDDAYMNRSAYACK